MSMHNPPHPGEFIQETYIMPLKLSGREVAEYLDVSPSTFSRLLRGESSVSPVMAYRLSEVLGRSPESWLYMQLQHDLWVSRDEADLAHLRRIDFSSDLDDAA